MASSPAPPTSFLSSSFLLPSSATCEPIPNSGEERVLALGPLRTSGNSTRYLVPYAEVLQGPDNDEIRLHWQEPVKGGVQVILRMDG